MATCALRGTRARTQIFEEINVKYAIKSLRVTYAAHAPRIRRSGIILFALWRTRAAAAPSTRLAASLREHSFGALPAAHIASSIAAWRIWPPLSGAHARTRSAWRCVTHYRASRTAARRKNIMTNEMAKYHGTNNNGNGALHKRMRHSSLVINVKRILRRRRRAKAKAKAKRRKAEHDALSAHGTRHDCAQPHIFENEQHDVACAASRAAHRASLIFTLVHAQARAGNPHHPRARDHYGASLHHRIRDGGYR